MQILSAPSFDSEVIESALEIVRRRAGLVFPSSRFDEAANAVRKIWRASGQTDPAHFIAQIETEPATFDALVNRLVVGESYFFREPAQFELIRDRVLPELRRRDPNLPPRGWSAGCATGEEPYSLAILLEQEGFADRAMVFGTDISGATLRSAREAQFRPWSLRSSKPEFVAKYFETVGEHRRLVDRIRRRVRFERHNLNDDLPPDFAKGMDLILCRNVLIYFDARAIERTARVLFDALDDDGWLITAPADPPLADLAPFSVVGTPAGLVYRRVRSVTGSMPRSELVRPVGKPRAKASSRRRLRSMPINPDHSTRVGALEIDGRQATLDAFAAGDFVRALALSRGVSNDPGARSLRVRALANTGDIDRALAEADEGIERFALDPELHCLRAFLAIGLGRDKDAVASLRRAIYLDRTLAMAHFALGAVLRRCGQMGEASRAFGNALAICEALAPDALVPLSDGETAQGLAEAARAELERIAATGAGA